MTAGRAQNGTFSAIMGPSGCGKTSLLDCLALRNQTFTGALRLDGLPLTGSFFLNTGACVSWCGWAAGGEGRRGDPPPYVDCDPINASIDG